MARCGLVLLWCLFLLVSSGSAVASVLHVETNGTDSVSCGAQQAPCRSISQAIDNAVAGDTIVVGPGRYGDANADGGFNDPGDEAAEVGVGCYCVLKVAKAVRIESSRGAEMTVIDGPTVNVEQVIEITAAGAVLGRLNRGFLISPSPIGAAGIPTGIQVVADINATVSGNAVVGARGRGIRVEGSGHTIVANVVRNSAIGLSVTGTQSVIEGNVLEANGSGGELGGSGHRVEGNVFIRNLTIGLQVAGNAHLVRRDAFLGNLHDGIRVLATNTTITEKNIFGNTCGLRNGSGSVNRCDQELLG